MYLLGFFGAALVPAGILTPFVGVPCRNCSTAYFSHIATFATQYRLSSVKGGTHTCLVNLSSVYEAHMSSALNGSSAVWHFERGSI